MKKLSDVQYVPMEFKLVQEVHDDSLGGVGVPLDYLSYMSFGNDVDGQRLFFAGSNSNEFPGRQGDVQGFTQIVALLVRNPAP